LDQGHPSYITSTVWVVGSSTQLYSVIFGQADSPGCSGVSAVSQQFAYHNTKTTYFLLQRRAWSSERCKKQMYLQHSRICAVGADRLPWYTLSLFSFAGGCFTAGLLLCSHAAGTLAVVQPLHWATLAVYALVCVHRH